MENFFDRPISPNANAALANNALQQVALEHHLSKQFSKADKLPPNLVDLIGEFGHAAIYSGIQSPLLLPWIVTFRYPMLSSLNPANCR